MNDNEIKKVFGRKIKHIQDLFDNDYLQSEKLLKEKLKIFIDTSDYEKIKILYLIAKNL